MRRVTIVVTVIIIAASIAVGVYFLSTQGGSQLDKSIGLPVTTSDMVSLQKVSDQPYGPTPSSAMQADVYQYDGSQFVTNGKPTIVFIGAEFCPYCAVERWAIITALNRFGNFSSLHYTTSANDEGDYASFTFVNSSYRSNYISFRPFEDEDRSGNALQTVPSNYSTVWGDFGNGFPFLDFGNTYVIKVSLLAFPDILTGQNWTAILNDISTSDATGLQIRQAANLITSVICKVTGETPAAVCTAPPIESVTSAISGPTQGSLTFTGDVDQAPVQVPAWPLIHRRNG